MSMNDAAMLLLETYQRIAQFGAERRARRGAAQTQTAGAVVLEGNAPADGEVRTRKRAQTSQQVYHSGQ